MRYKMFSVRDRAADMFGRPFFANTTGAAVRSFTDEINNAQSELAKHPEDYDLYEIGYFEDEFGTVTADTPKMVAIGKDIKV